MSEYFVVIPCAGNGSRFASNLPKQYHSLAGKTILEWALQAFLSVARISKIVLVVNPDDLWIEPYAKLSAKIIICKLGGATRANSVINGINCLACACNDWILVHDAARCCIRPQDIQRLIDKLANSTTGGILAQKAVDTIKLVDNTLAVQNTLDRNYIYLAQTPQMFRAGILRHALAITDLMHITDEASAVEQTGKHVQIIECGKHNLKVTYPEDALLAELILKSYNGVANV